VLQRLRHDRFIRCNDQEKEVDSANSSQHILDESLMTGYINEAQSVTPDLHVSKAEVDGDPTTFLFLETIRVNPCQGSDQGGLAVVYMAGCTDDQVSHAALF
jgi:hypothetical protein